MADINWGAITSQVSSSINKMGYDQRISNGLANALINGGSTKPVLHSPEEAGNKFIEVLNNSIDATDSMSAHAHDVLKHWELGAINTKNGIDFDVHIVYTDALHRSSLDPDRFPEGISNIVELLNKGVGHVMKPVYGTWFTHSYELIENIRSRTMIPATNFIENAIDEFKMNYGAEYGVQDITHG